MATVGAPSGLGVARPAFVHDPATGATSTPAIPTLSPRQFGEMPNWAARPAPQVQSALLAKPPTLPQP